MTPGDEQEKSEQDEDKLRDALDEKAEALKAEVEADIMRWQALHGGKGMPLCLCNHDPPCEACQASIEKGGNRCGCVQVRLREAVREAETHLQTAMNEVDEAVATLWAAQNHSDTSPSEILRCAMQGLSEQMNWIDNQFSSWFRERE